MLHGLVSNESQVSQIQKTYHDLDLEKSQYHFRSPILYFVPSEGGYMKMAMKT
jgi:hypothetical protein